MPKRDELSLRIVLALPKASRMGLLCRRRSRMLVALPVLTEQSARNCRIFFDASVLPAPDSPEMRMHCMAASVRTQNTRTRMCACMHACKADLVGELLLHLVVGLVADGVDVRRQLVQVDAVVDADMVVRVDVCHQGRARGRA